MGYTKLHSDIIASSIWVEDDRTLRIWVGLMAMADQDGIVHGSLPGLASVFRVSLEELEAALERFQSADRYSRTPLDEGRRVRRVPDGWLLVTHHIHRERSSPEERRAKKAARQARWRASKASEVARVDAPVDALWPQAEAEAEADTNPKAPATKTADLGDPQTVALMVLTSLEAGDTTSATYTMSRILGPIDVMWSGWRAYLGQPGVPVPKRPQALVPLLTLLADGRGAEEVAHLLSHASPDCWCRKQGIRKLDVVCRHIDELAAPPAAPKAPKKLEV